eukprot:Platyproteum_vivax@DN6250_c0_g1_i1.p1
MLSNCDYSRGVSLSWPHYDIEDQYFENEYEAKIGDALYKDSDTSSYLDDSQSEFDSLYESSIDQMLSQASKVDYSKSLNSEDLTASLADEEDLWERMAEDICRLLELAPPDLAVPGPAMNPSPASTLSTASFCSTSSSYSVNSV